MASDKVVATAASYDSFHADVIVEAPALNYQRLYDQVVRTIPSEDAAMQNEFAQKTTDAFLVIAETKQQPIVLTKAA
jgi:hypothetical protein